VKFSFIAKHRGSGRRLGCAGALGVSRGGFYAWRTRPHGESVDVVPRARDAMMSLIASDGRRAIGTSPRPGRS
jgi:hypothetical protein